MSLGTKVILGCKGPGSFFYVYIYLLFYFSILLFFFIRYYYYLYFFLRGDVGVKCTFSTCGGEGIPESYFPPFLLGVRVGRHGEVRQVFILFGKGCEGRVFFFFLPFVRVKRGSEYHIFIISF